MLRAELESYKLRARQGEHFGDCMDQLVARFEKANVHHPDFTRLRMRVEQGAMAFEHAVDQMFDRFEEAISAEPDAAARVVVQVPTILAVTVA
jgi:hypothetical protein